MEIRVGPIIRKIREQYGIEQQDLARTANISPSFLNDIEKSRSNPALDTFYRIAQTLGQNPGRLLNMALGITESTKHTTPILGTIRAGIPLLADANYEGELEIPADIHADFALQIRGDSMIGVGIHEGDYAICREAQTASSGQIVVALQDLATGFTNATLKFYFKEKDGQVLRAANPNFEDIPMNGEWRIGGVMVALLKKEPPTYRIYNNYLAARDINKAKWDPIIERAFQCGIKPKQLMVMLEAIERARNL